MAAPPRGAYLYSGEVAFFGQVLDDQNIDLYEFVAQLTKLGERMKVRHFAAEAYAQTLVESLAIACLRHDAIWEDERSLHLLCEVWECFLDKAPPPYQGSTLHWLSTMHVKLISSLSVRDDHDKAHTSWLLWSCIKRLPASSSFIRREIDGSNMAQDNLLRDESGYGEMILKLLDPPGRLTKPARASAEEKKAEEEVEKNKG